MHPVLQPLQPRSRVCPVCSFSSREADQNVENRRDIVCFVKLLFRGPKTGTWVFVQPIMLTMTPPLPPPLPPISMATRSTTVSTELSSGRKEMENTHSPIRAPRNIYPRDPDGHRMDLGPIHSGFVRSESKKQFCYVLNPLWLLRPCHPRPVVTPRPISSHA